MTTTTQPDRPAPIPCDGCGHLIGRHGTHCMVDARSVLCARCWDGAGRPDTRWMANRRDAARLRGL
jgi:hypothetical protein